MPFEKNHRLGFTSDNPLDRSPVCFKVLPDVKTKLKAIPNWQNRLREFVERLIEENKHSS
jgi:hypothetical protein